MEFRLHPPAARSHLSGRPFEDGEVRVSMLLRNQDGTWQRTDLAPEEVAGWSPPGPVICRWLSTQKAAREQPERRHLATAEEMWLALAHDPPTTEDGHALWWLLSLMLERKRRLRREGQVYRHVATGTSARVSDAVPSPTTLEGLREHLAGLAD